MNYASSDPYRNSTFPIGTRTTRLVHRDTTTALHQQASCGEENINLVALALALAVAYVMAVCREVGPDLANEKVPRRL